VNPPGASEPGRRGTILLLEDEPPLQRVMRRILERAGYRVHAISRIGDLAALDGELDQVDLVIADLVVADGSGAECARTLAARFPRVRCLLTSGFSPGEGSAADLGDTPFLQKPFTAEELLAAVTKLQVG
jgi:DNA-binding response OmpR family regulator